MTNRECKDCPYGHNIESNLWCRKSESPARLLGIAITSAKGRVWFRVELEFDFELAMQHMTKVI